MPIEWLEVLAYAVLVAPLAAALFVAFGALLRAPRRALDVVTIALSTVSLLVSVALAAEWPDEFSLPFSILGLNFYLDALSVYFLLVINLVAFFAAWYVPSYLARSVQQPAGDRAARFHALFNLFHFTMVLAPMIDNLVLLWMAVELTTLVSTLLVRFRGDRRALEAAWKYLTITTTGVILALLGTVFLPVAVYAGTAGAAEQGLALNQDVMSWYHLLQQKPIEGEDLQNIVRLAFLFAVIGYGTKAGFAPMHTWLPDGHGEAPSPVSALLSGVLLKSALFPILRFYTLTNYLLEETGEGLKFTSGVLLGVGLFSLVVATPFILKRNRFKRLLAYHSLEHMGIIAFGLGLGAPLAVFGALLHTLNHAVTKALMFLAYGHTQTLYARHLPTSVEPSDDEPLRGVLKAAPLHAALLAIGGLALVGSPPFNIFQSEFIILWAGVTQATAKMPWLGLPIIVFLATVVLIFGGLVVHLTRLLLGPAPFHLERESVRPLVPLVALVALIVLFGFVIPAHPVNFPKLIHEGACIVLGQTSCSP